MTQKQLFKQAARIAALYWDYHEAGPFSLYAPAWKKYNRAYNRHPQAVKVFQAVWNGMEGCAELYPSYNVVASLLMSEAYA